MFEDENLSYVRAALRKANDKCLGADFWKQVYDAIGKKEWSPSPSLGLFHF